MFAFAEFSELELGCHGGSSTRRLGEGAGRRRGVGGGVGETELAV